MTPQLVPWVSHRHQRWSLPIVTTPVQSPSTAVSSSPSTTWPVIDGGVTLTGGFGCTTPVCAVVTLVVPPPLVALTTTRSVAPTSAVVATYVREAAPSMSLHLAPVASQRRHL